MDVKLVMFREDGSRREFPLRRGATTIGRKEDCDIRVPLAEVSRRHAEIVVENDGVTLRDLGAANGTYLNNRRITEEDLEPGDQVMVGPVVFTVQIGGEPAFDEMIKIRTKLRAHDDARAAGPRVSASRQVSAEDEVDPIAALEALASSADQTAINPEDED
ncbi:MAG TPA: FHA domain-containing protein [Phycisphaerae bacterium]|nr:FHA domain-containing protein [Phycisphaerae bacterium]HNU45694.1 FHA domain-containing protein [Phycisphaerae bacterium]